MRTHPIISAVFVIIAGTIASWLALSADWLRRYDHTRYHE